MEIDDETVAVGAGEEEEDVRILARLTLKKLQEQGQLIRLLQAQVDFQSDQITKQGKLIQDLTDKVNELERKKTDGLLFGQGEESGGKKTEEEVCGDVGGIWKETKNLSLADAVKETAELTLMTNAGFVFDTASGLYCNYSTGYYYDPAQSLYYNGHTGVYYTYNADKQEYKFHSQVQLPSTENKTEKSKKKAVNKSVKPTGKSDTKKKTDSIKKNDTANDGSLDKEEVKVMQKTKKVKPIVKTEAIPEDVEEGELSDSSSESIDDEGMEDDNISEIESEEEKEAYPPCIRAIILESSSQEIKKGSLFLVTCMGGTIGREGLHHAIMLPDSQVDKSHANIQYIPDPNITEKKTEKYFIVDEGSETGTFLNGKRLSEEQEASLPTEIVHGSILKIGGFSILLHIHPGSFTCGHCEPGLLMDSDQANESSVAISHEKGKSRNAMMREIKKKYGINGPKPVADSSEKYIDRSHERRVKKGSDNPYEKTQVATIDESIGKSNKGFKMLAKMGWTGESLGKTGDQGLLEPIKLELKSDRGGLGLSPCLGDSASLLKKSKHVSSKSKQSRVEQLAITMKRFKEAESSGATKSKEASSGNNRMDCDDDDNNETST